MFTEDMFLAQYTLFSYDDIDFCKDMCNLDADCKAIAVSPASWGHMRECFLLSGTELGPAVGWTSLVKSCK